MITAGLVVVVDLMVLLCGPEYDDEGNQVKEGCCLCFIGLFSCLRCAAYFVTWAFFLGWSIWGATKLDDYKWPAGYLNQTIVALTLAATFIYSWLPIAVIILCAAICACFTCCLIGAVSAELQEDTEAAKKQEDQRAQSKKNIVNLK